MEWFTIYDSIIAGLIGTLLMTLFIRVIAAVTGYQLDVPRILGTLLTFSTQPSGQPSSRPGVKLTGVAVHYTIGILFALAYAFLISRQLLQPGYRDGLLFGTGAGLLGVMVWLLTLKLHPLAPSVRTGLFLPAVFLGHLLFAAGIVTIFNLLSTFNSPL